MTDIRETVDASEREIIEYQTSETLFVNAGAGAGKTFLLVRRIGSLVLEQGAAIESIAAITFTEAAASELKARVFTYFEDVVEELAGTQEPQSRLRYSRALKAVESIDNANITTLHSFAKRILSEFALEAGLPPSISIVDKAKSSLDRDRRWRSFVDGLYQDDQYSYILTLAEILGIVVDPRSSKMSSLRSVIDDLYDNWDRIDAWQHLENLERFGDSQLETLLTTRTREFLELTRDLPELIEGCSDTTDSLAKRMIGYIGLRQKMLTTEEPIRRLVTLLEGSHTGTGAKKNWDASIESVRSVAKAIKDLATTFVSELCEAVLRRLALPSAREAVAAAQQRRSEGSLVFHDLLVICRQLLTESPSIRKTLHNRFECLLLDEFQDTDPLQIEIATLIATSSETVKGVSWVDLEIPDGRLFFVGDPKQSIYRFRRAEIELYANAQNKFGAGLQTLAQNFRTVQPILSWANAVFEHNFSKTTHQVKYGALEAYRQLPASDDTYPQRDHRPVLFGAGRLGAKSAELRLAESKDIAGIIKHIVQTPHEWPVFDKDLDRWRDARASDITILIPARKVLEELEPILTANHISYHLRTGSLIFASQEVRDVMSVAKAIHTAADEVALVATLRSPFYGCSDIDLFHWKEAGHRWSISKRLPDEVTEKTRRVHNALTHLRELWKQRWFITPTKLVTQLIGERHARQAAFAHPDPTKVWARYSFIEDIARQFEENGGASIREFTDWVAELAEQEARVDEPVGITTEDGAVNIATMHGSKGLEFPITILAGMSSRLPSSTDRHVYFDDDNHIEIRAKKTLETQGFGDVDDLERELLRVERGRLLYVAATRARDHLIVSLHHEQTKSGSINSYGAVIVDALGAVDSETLSRRLDFIDEGAAPLSLQDDTAAADVEGDSDVVHPDVGQRQIWIETRNELAQQSRWSKYKSATDIARIISEREVGDESASELANNTGSETGREPESEATRAVTPEVAPTVEGSQGESGLRRQVDSKPKRRERKGRKGAAIGTATHNTLEEIDFAQYVPPLDNNQKSRLKEIIERNCHEESISEMVPLVEEFVLAALGSDVIKLARSNRHHKEVFITQEINPNVSIEGYIDLLIDTDDGYVIVDYKTDAATTESELRKALERYSPQGATYALALEELTAKPVIDCYFLFINKNGTTQCRIDDLDTAKAQVKEVITT